MSKFHVNPNTGNVAPCTAKAKCPFGDLEKDHYATPELARAAFESTQNTSFHTTRKKTLTFDELKNRVLPEDTEKAIEAVMRDVASQSNYSWKAIMGESYRTNKTLDYYNSVLREEVLNSPEHMTVVNKIAARRAENFAYARAYKEGIAIDPKIETAFEQMWNDPGFGFGEAKIKEKIEEYEKLQDELEGRRITPTKIIGSGYKNPRRVAHEYLESSLQELRESLDTRGRSHSVNIANALHRAKG